MTIDREKIRRFIELTLIETMAIKNNRYYIPAAVSNRHVHLSEAHIEALFGKGHTLHKIKNLVQPGQYACEEQVAIIGGKGQIERIRVLGPARSETQVELSITDAYRVGIKPVIRMSGDIAGTPGGKLVGPAGEVALSKGVIVARRHLHVSEEQAGWLKLKDGDVIRLRQMGERPVVFENVAVRCGSAHTLEMHIDMDEANAAAVKGGCLLEIVK